MGCESERGMFARSAIEGDFQPARAEKTKTARGPISVDLTSLT